MALCAQRNQVVAGVGPKLTSPFDVVDLYVVSCTAVLAAPAISLKNSVMELPLGFWPELQPRALWVHVASDAFGLSAAHAQEVFAATSGRSQDAAIDVIHFGKL
jgi:hypothetical protein